MVSLGWELYLILLKYRRTSEPSADKYSLSLCSLLLQITFYKYREKLIPFFVKADSVVPHVSRDASTIRGGSAMPGQVFVPSRKTRLASLFGEKCCCLDELTSRWKRVTCLFSGSWRSRERWRRCELCGAYCMPFKLPALWLMSRQKKKRKSLWCVHKTGRGREIQLFVVLRG